MSANHRTCRACHANSLSPILSLGNMPLANSLLSEEQLSLPEEKFPLELGFCPHCTLVQLLETVPPERIFRDYLYFSSFSTTMLAHSEALAKTLIASRGLGPKSLVIEIASNDGYLLQYFKKAGIPVIGIEPALNVAEAARRERGIPTLTEFFGKDLANKLAAEGKKADVIIANNVMAHVEDLSGFVSGLHTLLKEDGIAVIEVPYVREMIEHCEFDTIYHEHIFYFSVTALADLFSRHGLLLSKVEKIPMHGGSLMLFVVHSREGASHDESVDALLQDERNAGLTQLEYYSNFSHRVEALKRSLRGKIRELKLAGKRLAAYGAAAKGTILLNYCGLGKEFLEFVVDRNQHKQHKYMPGVHIPIYPPDRLLESRPDYVLLLTWNFAEEILSQQAGYRDQGGKFIIPVPEPMVV